MNENTSDAYLHFFNNLKNQLECLDFPNPKLELPTVTGTVSGAEKEGRG